MVRERNDACGFEQFIVVFANDLGTHQRVLAHDFPFAGVELARFEQDGVRNADLADIVHRRRAEHDIGRLRAQAVGFGDQAAVVAHAQDVVAGFVVLEFGGPTKAPDDLLAGADQLMGALAHHALQLARLIVKGKMRPHARPDDGRADRLGDVIDRPDFQTALFILNTGHRCDENDRNPAPIRVGFEAAADFQTTETRHHDVEQDQIGRIVRIDNLQRLLARGGNPDVVVGGEDFGQQINVVRDVVDNQNALFGEQVRHFFSGQGFSRRDSCCRVRLASSNS